MANSTTFNIILKGIADFKDVASNIDVIQKNLNQLKLPADLKSKFTGIFSELEKESAKYQKYLDSGFKTKGDVTGLEKTGNRIKSLFESLASTMQKINPNILKDSFVIDTKQFDDLTQKIQKAKQEMSDLANQGETAKAFQNIQTALEKIGSMSKSKSISAFSEAFKTGNIEEAQAALAKLYQNVNKFGDGKQTEFKSYLDLLSGALQTLAGNTALQDKQKELQGFISQLSTLEKTQIKNFFKSFESFKGAVSGQAGEWNKYRVGVEGAASSVFDLSTQMDQLKHRIGYFFGITNMFNLFKRTVREAINTVKELDAVMTETAVVTDFDIGDMWNKLPQYAAQANALGASIKDLYAATTLYYQQGLQSEAAMGVGVETMKMARIAGMEAAEATQAMTAALRGFNMEVNEMNAQRVNDVYSELAAITAADTSQIATAMSKTASIANSANMEFETTAALLAQIIETTQEAPETAGTAMKTIIARFTEVKQLFSEGMLTGKDEEGEEININKIDAALKTVGISLKDFLNGSKGIDDIFLELASKWDTLDLATQRYIATMAAGSRQQSRFIAMMSNYDRTMELVSAANSSAGASQEQFDKTLESMEAKLQKLKNAWDQFIMGLANNDLLKAGVDALTGLLNAINGIISGLSGGSGAIKSIVSLLAIVGALKGGQALARGIFEPGASGISFGYGKGFQMSLGKKSAVDQVVGANSSQRAQQLGRQHGLIYVKSFRQGAGTGGGLGGFFGNKIGSRVNMASLSKQVAIDNRSAMDQLKAGKISQQQWKDQIKKNNQKLINARNHNKIATAEAQWMPNFSHISMGAMAAGSAITLLSKAFKDAGPQGQAFGRVLEKIGTTMTGIGSIGMMLGPTLNNLGMTFSKSGVVLKNVIVGADAAADSVRAVGDVAKTTGKTLEVVGDGAETVGDGAVVAGKTMTAGGKAAAASWAQVGAVLGWVALVLAVVAAVAVTAYFMHPQTQLKQAKKAADNAEKGAQNAATAFQELNNSIDQLDEKKAKIDELTRGTKEWKQEVTALNDEVLKLVEQNPELASFVKNNNGILEFDKSGNTTDSFGRTYEDVMAIEEAQVNAAKAAAYDAQRTVLKKQEAVEYLDYANDKAGQGIGASRMRDRGINGDFAKLTNSLARAISNGELLNIKYGETEEDYLHNQEIFSDYIHNNFDYSEVQADILAEELMKEASALQQFGNSLAQVDAQMNLYNDQLASTIVESAGVAEGTKQAQILENLDSSILANIYDSVYDQARADTLGDKTRKERREAYADLMGYEWAGGNKYNTENGQITVRPEEMRAALASQEATSQAGEKAAELAKDIASKSTSQQELIGALFNSDGSGMTRKVLSEWGAYNSTTGQYELDLSKAPTQQTISKEGWAQGIKDSQGNPAIWAEEYVNSFAESITAEEAMKKMQQAEVANQIAIESGYTDIKEMANAFGTTVDGAVSLIVNSLESGGDAFLDTRKNIAKKMSKYAKTEKSYEKSALDLKSFEDKFGAEFIDTLANVFNSLELSGNEDFSAFGVNTFREFATDKTKQEMEDVSNFVENVNWGNSIEAAAALREEIKHGTGAAKEFAQTLSNANLNYLSIGSQTQTLFQYEQFGEIQDELDEILETSEAISASDVKDLANSYKILDNYLENTEITASGLAKALTEVQNGTLTFDQLTTAVMSALSSFNSLEDTIANTLDELENFDLGPDENQIAAKTKEWAEILRANLDKGAYGNSQSDAILDYMFGADWDKVDGKTLTGDAYVERMNNLTKFVEQNTENYFNAWSQFAKGQTMSGGEVEYSDSTRVGFGADGGIKIDNIGNKTTKELSAWISETYGVTENVADMMISDLANYSTDIRPVLEENDYQAGIQAAIDNGTKMQLAGIEDFYSGGVRISEGREAGEYTLIDEQEIQAIHEATGRAYDEIKADFEARGALITNFFDEEGVLKQGRELFNEINEVYGGDFAGQFNKTEKTYNPLAHAYYDRNYYDLAGFESGLDNFGFNQAQKDQIVNEQLAQLTKDGKSVEVQIETDTGEFMTVMAEAGDTIDELKEKANMSEEANAMGEALKNAIVAAYTELAGEAITITPNADTDSIQTQLAEVDFSASVNPNLNVDLLSKAIEDWQTQHGNVAITATLSQSGVSLTGSNGQTATITFATFAKGIKNAPGSFDALTGEEGPELVQTKDGAYLVGQNGPEMAHINKGDTVYTAEQTKKIFKGSNPSLMPRFNDGYGNRSITGYGGISSSGGSGGRSASDDEGYKTSIDKLYNLLRDIDEELRIREALERRYTKILEGLNTTAKSLVDVSFQELEQLKKERGLNEQRIAGRQQQIQQYQQENSKYNKYAWSETDEHGNMVLRIDWAAINAISDEEEGKGVEEYLSQLEEWFGDIEEAEDNIIDIEEAVKEIKERGKDEYFDLENQIKEALENERQKEIDKLSEINESINDTNSRLLEAMQDSIEQQRQDRENEKTEEELADKQRRLAYLQQDTSGANALEIMQLQKEIEEGQEDYTDTLIDQKISELQKQNDEAAEQREKQIAILQAQLDKWIESGEVWARVYELMEHGIDEDGIIVNSELYDLLLGNAEYPSMSNLEKWKFTEELEDLVAQAILWLQVGNQLENLEMEGKTISFTTKDGKEVSGTVGKDGSITTADGTTYKGVYRNYDGSYTTEENYTEPKKEKHEPEKPANITPSKPEITEQDKWGVANAVWNGNQGWGSGNERVKKLKEVFGENNNIQNNYVAASESTRKKNMVGSYSDYSYSKMKEKYVQYLSGGLADFTGPAWLDGTKTKPEYVLNSDQTRAFFTLVDVLESLRLGTTKSSENSGDTNYDIDINVESIGSDYDVEQMAGTIKRLINDDARYRNNNAVNLMR